MPKRILLAWELGAGRGHLLNLGWIADVLRGRGFEPVFALQRLDGIETIRGSIGTSEVYQAPVWPGLIDRSAYRSPGQDVTFGDVLVGLGLGSPMAVEGMLRAWDQLIVRLAPAAVVADFAPACLAAVRGKVPTVAVGDGFTLPPATLERFTILGNEPGKPKFDETETLSVLNDVLLKQGRGELRALPELFIADRASASSFVELDPYRNDRKEPLVAPWVPDWNRSVSMSRDEIFAYFSIDTETRSTIFLALTQVVRAGLRVRVYIPQLDTESSSWLTANGVSVESAPVPFEQIQRNASLLISLGSLGFVSCGLVSGIPQLVIPPSLATRATGFAFERLGAGRSVLLNPASPIEPTLLAQVIAEAYENTRFSDKAKSLAPDFARRLEPNPAEVAADLVSEIV